MDPTAFEAAKQAFFDGVAHLEAQRWAEAEAALRRSLQHLPGRPSTLQNLALALLRQDRPAEALAAKVHDVDGPPATILCEMVSRPLP